MSFSPRTVYFNTNPYAPGFGSSQVLIRNEIPTLPAYYYPASSYLEFWYPRLAQFWRIPKGSKNIRFKIPHWYTDKKEWTATFNNAAKSLHPNDATRQDWLKNAQNLISAANQAASVLGISPPDPDLVYTMQDTKTLEAAQIASYCHNCNASIQVFHTNGRLLSGTPLTNWNRARGSYWDFGYVGMVPSSNTGPSAESEPKWRQEGLWVTWYEVIQTAKAGKNYFDSINPGIIPADGTIITPAMITAALKELYPSIFPPTFKFDDSVVNGTGQELLKTNSYTLNNISADSESINWSGNVAGAIGTGAGTRMDELGVWPPLFAQAPSSTPHTVIPSETLEIAVANEDLIIGVICNDYVGVVGYWDEYIEDAPLPTGPYTRELGDCPATLRYHPIHTYQAPYPMTSVTCTDRLHKKIAVYFPIRDQVSCIEIRRTGDGVNTGGKRIYVDHSFWYQHSPNPVELMDMSFGYDYQRLYVLYKQSVDSVPVDEGEELWSNSKHYRAWITMYNTNLPDGTITDSRVSIPLYGFIKSDQHVHPYRPTSIDTVLGYMRITGLTGELIDKPELAPTFNILSAHDKLFATIPCLFRPVTPQDGGDDPWWWRPRDVRLLCQLLYMFDETYSTFNNVAVIGAVSPWLENWQTPLPDIEPKYPLKLRMNLNDEMVLWTLADLRRHPTEYYDPNPTKDKYPDMLYLPNSWDGTDLPDRFWQPLTLEAVKIDDLINTMNTASQAFEKPVSFRGTQVYVHNPANTDMYSDSDFTWEGQRVFGTRDHFLYEDRVVYHNFRRQILTGIGPVTRLVPGGIRQEFPEREFNPITSWDGELNLFPFSQPVTLEPGKYHAYLRGADGAPAIDGDNGAVYSSGGQGATVQIDFTVTETVNLDVYAGGRGTSYEGGQVSGGNGGSYVVDSDLKDSIWNTIPDVRQLRKSQRYIVPIGGFGLFFKVPAGATNVKLKIIDPCPVHNASFQTFHTDGTMLTGTLLAGTDNLWSWFQGGGSANEGQSTAHMREVYGDALPLDFVIDSSEANEKLGQQPYTANPKTFHVDGETIKWTGNITEGNLGPGNGVGEELLIQRAYEDIIVGVLSSHDFTLAIEYDLADWDSNTSYFASVLAGGGGGLTGIFLGTLPIAVAGSGGGGGNPIDLLSVTLDESSIVTEVNGGHGGSLEAGYGTLYSSKIQRGGSQSNGYKPFIGQSALQDKCGAGGGGAGYYGGTASQVQGPTGSGGGGGSSFILGASGYGTHPSVDSIQITSYTVTPGKTPPWSNPKDGQVIISGYSDKPKLETVIDYQFIAHDVGDMYYQCSTAADMNLSPSYYALNVIILNDCTFSMYELIQTLSGAMPALVSGVAGSDYNEVQYAAIGYANDQIIVATNGSPGYFTKDESILQSRMQYVADLCRARNDNVPTQPFGMGEAESWADAIIQSYNLLQSSLLTGNTMFVIVTDDINSWDNPPYKADQAKTLCTSNNGSVTWVLPVNYGPKAEGETEGDYYSPESLAITTETGGSFIKGMVIGSSDWGGAVAQKIVEAAPEPKMLEELGYAHVFSIENLASNTYMCDVTLTSTKSSIRLGYLPQCNPAKPPFGLSGDMPMSRTVHWDEIPPHSEAYFVISVEPPKLTIPGASTWNGHSYKIIEQQLTWAEAKVACENLGGHLVDILSQEEEDFIESIISADTIYHIGGHCPANDNTTWVWVTGEPWGYTNWKPGEPGHTGDYACFWNDGTKLWHDGNVGTKAWFICEWDYDEIPAPPPLSCEAIKSGIKLNYYLEGR